MSPVPADDLVAAADTRVAASPDTGNGQLALSWRGQFDPRTKTLYCGHSAGFFSSCCVTLWNLQEVQRAGRALPERIDFSASFASFRNADQRQRGTDLYPLFFQPDPGARVPAGLPRVDHHGLYRFLDYARINPAMARYFQPSEPAVRCRAELVRKYRIDPATTLAVVYRGTDKGTEVRVAPPEAYLAEARRLLARNPGFRIWIQTDEHAVRSMFCREFGERCFYLDEMPVSSNGRVIHEQEDAALKMDRSDFGVLLIAVTSLLAQCAVVVNHTGNMGLWVCLFRGHARGVWQFDDEGRVINPLLPGSAFGALRRFRIKAVRKLRRAVGLGAQAQ
jgi:hypothetical protein